MTTPFDLKSVSLINFRGFRREVDIPLAPLTFLVGPNSSGKSSIFSAISLLAQSGFPGRLPLPSEIVWSGRLVDVGSFRDAVYGHIPTRKMQIGLQFSSAVTAWRPWLTRQPTNLKGLPMRLTITLRQGDKDSLGEVDEIEVTDVTSQQSISITVRIQRTNIKLRIKFPDRIRMVLAPKSERRYQIIDSRVLEHVMQYRKSGKRRRGGTAAGWKRIASILGDFGLEFLLGGCERVASGRSAPQRSYPLTRSRVDERGALSLGRVDSVDPGMISESKSVRPSEFRRQRRAARVRLEQFLEKLEIASDATSERLSPYHSSISVKDSHTEITSNLVDVGFGASQIIPVIRACQSESMSPLFVEQPEIHLHPRAQGHVADLLIDTSKDRQVLVETHSVHLINQARLRVAKGELKSQDVIVLYVCRNSSGSHVKSIPILENGDFAAEWPEGFFEERYQETLALLDAKNKHDE